MQAHFLQPTKKVMSIIRRLRRQVLVFFRLFLVIQDIRRSTLYHIEYRRVTDPISLRRRDVMGMID